MLQLIYSVAILLNKMLNALKVPRWSTAVTPLRRAVKCDGEASHLTVGRFVYVRYLFAFTPCYVELIKGQEDRFAVALMFALAPGHPFPNSAQIIKFLEANLPVHVYSDKNY